MLELNRQQGVPQFVAAVDLLASARRPAAGVGIATTVPPVVGVGVGAEAKAATGANLDRPIVNEARSRDLVEAATQIAASPDCRQPGHRSSPPAPWQPQVNELVWAWYAWVRDGGRCTSARPSSRHRLPVASPLPSERLTRSPGTRRLRALC
ncbi:MAG: hypothetical protein IPK05_18215 [Comamonadaceae bacterium]|nr:hypothetical protein [Comamonadaceae bacterium]